MRQPFAAIRGGNWNNGPQAGVFALNMNNGPSNSNNNIGARCCRQKYKALCRNLRPHGDENP